MDVKVDLRVVELLASRLCHDLVSPVGALGNGLELLEEAPTGVDAEALQLCLRSHRRATALLQFFRLAYGASGRSAPRLPEARDATLGLLQGEKLRLTWPTEIGAIAAPNGTGQLLMNLVLLGAEALPRGGELAVELTEHTGVLQAIATASGADVRLPEEARIVLDGPVESDRLTPKSVQAYFVTKLAEGFGAALQVAASPGLLRLSTSLDRG